MLKEKPEKVLAIARDFGWDIADGQPYKDFRLGFNFYLKNAAHMHGSEWKLINQIMDHGCVYLNKRRRCTSPSPQPHRTLHPNVFSRQYRHDTRSCQRILQNLQRLQRTPRTLPNRTHRRRTGLRHQIHLPPVLGAADPWCL